MPVLAQVRDGSKRPYSASEYADQRGIVDYGNLVQFAPYETGYAFIACLGVPIMMNVGEADFPPELQYDGRQELLNIFVSTIEKEFKSFDGVTDMNGQTQELNNNITSMTFLAGTERDTSVSFSVRVTEKSGTPITTFIETFLRFTHDPNSKVRTYGGLACSQSKKEADPATKYMTPSLEKEVFSFLVGFTDSSMLNVEKAYIFANAQPQNAAHSDLYSYERGDVTTKDLTVNFTAFLMDGKLPNEIAQAYVDTMVNNSPAIEKGKINVNSFNYDWTYTDASGNMANISSIKDSISAKLTGGNSSLVDMG